MANKSKASNAANKYFKQREKDVAMTEYETRRKAVQVKSAALKELRLAKEAADREIAETEAIAKEAEAKAKAAEKARKVAEKAAKLAEKAEKAAAKAAKPPAKSKAKAAAE